MAKAREGRQRRRDHCVTALPVDGHRGLGLVRGNVCTLSDGPLPVPSCVCVLV